MGARAEMSDSADQDAVAGRVRESGALDLRGANAGVLIFRNPLEQDADEGDRTIRISVHAPHRIPQG